MLVWGDPQLKTGWRRLLARLSEGLRALVDDSPKIFAEAIVGHARCTLTPNDGSSANFNDVNGSLNRRRARVGSSRSF